MLDEAADETNPLLERLRFLAITASNLDEFFMVRVGGLKLLIEQGITTPDPSGLTPQEQMKAISVRAHKFVQDQQAIFKEVDTKLKESGIRWLRGSELSERRLKAMEQVFESEIFSVLTPMAVSPGIEFPLILNVQLHLCVQLKPDPAAPQHPRFALIPIGRALSRFLTAGGPERGYAYALLEDVVARFLDRFFPGETVESHATFRITRNADFTLRDDLAPDVMAGMQGILTARKHGGLCAAGSCRRRSTRDACVFAAIAGSCR